MRRGEEQTVKRMKINFHNPDASKDSYAYFLLCKDSIALFLKQGFQIKRIWETYKQADPPFPGSYSVFCRYCAKHELNPRGRTEVAPPAKEPIAAVPSKSEETTSAPKIDIEKYRNRFDFNPHRSKQA